MEMKQQFNLKQTQSLTMNPVMQEAIRLLQMSTMELMQYLRQEISENPALEEIDDLGTFQEDEEDDHKTDDTIDPPDNFQPEWEDYFEDSSDSGFSHSAREKTEKIFFEGAIEKLPTLSEHLEWQLRLSAKTDREFKIGQILLSEMNNDGYIQDDDESISKKYHDKFQMTPQEIRNIRYIIQQFDPVGIGAHDLRECLLIQLKYNGSENTWSYKIVENHLADIEKNRLPRIAKKLGIQLSAVKKAREEISKLELSPGRLYDNQEVTYVVPDVLVEKINGDYVITLNTNYLPNLAISPRYRTMLKRKSLEIKTRKYILEKYKKAVWLIKTIAKSKNTLYRVTESILKFQKEYFEYGIRFLKPLTLKEIAEDIQMHESTISRVTTQKYLQCGRGIFELKYFFSSAVSMEGGIQASSKSVKEIIKDIIDVETPKKPLSDQKITEMLMKRGYNLARRTVTKYRESLQVLPASKRKKY